MPEVEGDLQAIGEIRAKALGRRIGESRLEGFEVGIEVEAQIPMVEIARADAHPVIDQNHLQVQEARLVLENPHPGPEQFRVVALPGEAHRRVIGMPPAEQQAHVDTPRRRFAQSAAHSPGRQKIRRGEPDTAFAQGQRAQQRTQDIPVLPGVGVSHPAQPLPDRRLGQVREAQLGPHMPAEAGIAGQPLAVEQLLPVADQGAADFHHQLVPGALRLAGRPELVGSAGAADKGGVPIDQQQLAVVAVEIAQAAAPAQRVVPAHLHAGIAQALSIGRHQPLTTEVVEQAAHRNATQRRGAQHIHHNGGASAAFDQVLLELDVMLGGLDQVDHPWKEHRPVIEQNEPITLAPGKNRLAHSGAARKPLQVRPIRIGIRQVVRGGRHDNRPRAALQSPTGLAGKAWGSLAER